MEIMISVMAYYTNGHSEYFKERVEVTDEELEAIRTCATDNRGNLRRLRGTSPELYKRLSTQCRRRGRSEGLRRGGLQPVRILGNNSTVYRHRDTELLTIVMKYKEGKVRG